MLKKIAVLFVATFFVSLNAWANEDYLALPPVIPAPLADGESIEPEINIIQESDRTVQEYRHNGELYMVKIIPAVGPAYYYIDTDGDGSLESQQFELQSGIVPNWILFKW
jgi:hypothetical protein